MRRTIIAQMMTSNYVNRGRQGTRTSGNAVSRMAEDGEGRIDADVVEATDDDDYNEDHRATSSRVARLEAK